MWRCRFRRGVGCSAALSVWVSHARAHTHCTLQERTVHEHVNMVVRTHEGLMYEGPLARYEMGLSHGTHDLWEGTLRRHGLKVWMQADDPSSTVVSDTTMLVRVEGTTPVVACWVMHCSIQAAIQRWPRQRMGRRKGLWWRSGSGVAASVWCGQPARVTPWRACLHGMAISMSMVSQCESV